MVAIHFVFYRFVHPVFPSINIGSLYGYRICDIAIFQRQVYIFRHFDDSSMNYDRLKKKSSNFNASEVAKEFSWNEKLMVKTLTQIVYTIMEVSNSVMRLIFDVSNNKHSLLGTHNEKVSSMRASSNDEILKHAACRTFGCFCFLRLLKMSLCL